MTVLPDGVPSLDSLSSDWLAATELDHLHSLRNQHGQAHVNPDLLSISWLAMPPYVGGYRTGTLRVDGSPIAADAFNWAPWGVRRRGTSDGLEIETDTRLGYEDTSVFWHVRVTNTTDEARTADLDVELLAPIAHSVVDWGWLHGTPWNTGHVHDYYATERIRTDVTAQAPSQVQLVTTDERNVRLGRPRLVGIQRDEEDAPMLLETTLPAHFTEDSPARVLAPAVPADVAWVSARPAGADEVRFAGPWSVASAADEVRLPAFAMGDGGELTFAVTLRSSADGVLLTHGNHPDSLQFRIADGELVAIAGGEPLRSGVTLAPGREHILSARVSSAGATLSLDGEIVARSADWRAATRWAIVEDGTEALVTDTASPAVAAFALTAVPDASVVDGQRRIVTWQRELAPGESFELGIVLTFGDDAQRAAKRARVFAARFEAAFDAVAERWRELWSHAFTPFNPTHSGHLPTFVSDDHGLELTYYYGVLLALYMRNTGVSEIGPVFLTGGPRLGATTTFYWDQSEWARIGAMLEPTGVRNWIVAALSVPYDRSHSFDTWSLTPVGNHYAANDHALFTIIEHYVGVTGDDSVLDEIAAGRTVLDHLREMAGRVDTQRAAYGRGDLVDLGRDAWELLECVPNYRDAVVSFNAGYAGMLRSLGALVGRLGETGEAAALAARADELTAAVLAQYDGGGRWRIAHPDGETTIGHCLDFELVAARIPGALSDTQRAEMVAFVDEHLIDGDWMRALAQDDPIAPFSDRPDHGAAGAFAGWPGSTSYGLSRLGRQDIAAKLLSRAHRARSGALWGQAVEAQGDGTFRVAERGVSNRDSNAAVAVSEAIIAGLFGIEAGFEETGVGSLRTEWGELRSVRAVGFDLPLRGSAAPITATAGT